MSEPIDRPPSWVYITLSMRVRQFDPETFYLEGDDGATVRLESWKYSIDQQKLIQENIVQGSLLSGMEVQDWIVK